MTHTQSEDTMTSEEITLSDVILDIAAGPFGSNLKVSCFVDDGFPIIDGANLKGFKVTDNVTKFVTEEKACSLHRAIAKRGDVVVTISGTLGQIAYIPEDSQYEEYLVSQRQFRVTFDESKVCIPYIVYYFHSFEGQHKILMFANQVGVPALAQPLKNFRQIKMILPPLDVQRRIAAVLKPLDDKIELNARINARLERVAQALFKRQFVRFEPYGGTMPPVWRVCRADEYFDITIGKTPPRKEPQWFSEEKGNTTWISISDMGKSGAYISDSSEYLTPEAVERFNVCIVPDNTVILSFKLTVGRVAITDGTMTTNEAIAHFKTDKPEINEYLYLYLKSFRYETLGSTSSIATAVNSKIIKAMPFIVPSDEVIKAFHETVSPMFNMIKHNLRQSRTLARLRDVLLPRLMSGAVDVGQVRLNTMQEGGSR